MNGLMSLSTGNSITSLSSSFDNKDLHTNLGTVAVALLGVAVAKHAFKELKKIIDSPYIPEQGKRNLYTVVDLKYLLKVNTKKF